jgi:hypothetical protein
MGEAAAILELAVEPEPGAGWYMDYLGFCYTGVGRARAYVCSPKRRR